MSSCSHVAPDVPESCLADDVDRFGCRSMARTLVIALCELLEVHGAPAPVRQCFRRQAKAHLCVLDPAEYLKRSKNFLCGFKATYLGEELPDQSGYVCTGQFRKWIRSRLRSKARVASTSLFAALAKAKSAAEPLNCGFVYLQCAKAASTLPLPDTATVEDVDATIDAIYPLLDELAVYLGKQFSADEESFGEGMWSQFATSTKACIEFPRSMHGQLGYFLDRMWQSEGVAVPGDFLTGKTFPIETYVKMSGNMEGHSTFRKIERKFESYFPDLEYMTLEYYEARLNFTESRVEHYWETVKGARWEEPMTHGFYDENLKLVESQEDPHYAGLLEEGPDDDGNTLIGVDVVYPETLKAWERATDWHTSEEHGLLYKKYGCTPDAPIPISMTCVCEPLKCRLVGLGPAARNRKMIWFQKTCHTWMKRIPCFRLLGKAPKATDIKDCVEHRSSAGEGDLGNEASDFSGASDGTPEDEREEMMEVIITYLPGWYKEIVRLDNGRHKIRFPSKQTMEILYPLPPGRGGLPEDWPEIGKGLKGRAVTHIRGTLMGNLSSFIILSLMVAAVAIKTLREEGDERPLAELLKAFLVNGDDFYAAWRRSVHERFWENCRKLQFGKSIGKSFFHPTYANINSQSYHMDLRSISECKKIPVLNLGLLQGRKKLAKDPFDPTTVISELLDGCRSARMEHRVLRIFIKRFKGRIHGILRGRNLFLPVSLGGMGQRKPLHFNRKSGELRKAYCLFGQKVTQRQQRMSSIILSQRANLHLVPFGPTRDPRTNPDLKTPLPWDTIGAPSVWNVLDENYQFAIPEFEGYYGMMLRHYDRRGGLPVRLIRLRELQKCRAVELDVPRVDSDSMDFFTVTESGESVTFRGERVSVEVERKVLREELKPRIPDTFSRFGVGRVEATLDLLSRNIDFLLRDKTRYRGSGVDLFGEPQDSRNHSGRTGWSSDLRPMKLGRRLPRFEDPNPHYVRHLQMTSIESFFNPESGELGSNEEFGYGLDDETLLGAHGSHTGWDDLDNVEEAYRALSDEDKFLFCMSIGVCPRLWLHETCDLCGERIECDVPGCRVHQCNCAPCWSCEQLKCYCSPCGCGSRHPTDFTCPKDRGDWWGDPPEDVWGDPWDGRWVPNNFAPQ